MTETDDVLDVLRRARPDDLADEQVSPHSTAAQALLADILSRPAAAPGTRDDPTVTLAPAGDRGRPALVAAAVAVVAAALVGSLLAVRSSEPSAAATIDAASTRTSELIERTGRAVQHYRFDAGAPRSGPDEEWNEYEFSGNDGSVTYRPGGHIFRVVDGVGYTYEPVPPNYEHFEWRRLQGDYAFSTYPDGAPGALHLDPRTLLETLRSAGDFEVVGNEEVDGVPTRRLRATDPDAALDMGQLRQGVEGTGTSLEVWVDDDDLIRRIDFHIDQPWDLDRTSWSSSTRFFDLGEPVVIEAPIDAPVWEPPPDADE